jgi:hypothetical protein
MATPILLTSQPTPGAGIPGVDRNDLVTGELVSISDTEAANAGATYSTIFLDTPIGSAATIADPLTATPSFTPDVTGTYWFETSATIGGVTATADMSVAVPLATTGARIPAFRETSEYNGGGNTRGWHEALTAFMRQTDAILAAPPASTGLTLIQTQTIGVATDTVSFAGLNGDVDQIYEWSITWEGNAVGTQYLTVDPNAVVTNQLSVWMQGGGVPPASLTVTRGITAVSPSRDVALVSGTMYAKTGGIRRWNWYTGVGTGATASNYRVYTGTSVWTDTVANITSLQFRAITSGGSLTGTGFQPGTQFSLYRRAI